GRGGGQAADDVDAVPRVAADDVAIRQVGAADDVVGGALDVDAVGAVGAGDEAGRIDSDEVAGDGVPVALHEDAVRRGAAGRRGEGSEAVDHQARDDAAAAAGSKHQAVGVGPGALPVQLDEGRREGVGARLAVAVDGHRLDDRRQGDPGGAGVGADVDRP